MPWAQEQATPESIGAFLSQASADWDDGSDFQSAKVPPKLGYRLDRIEHRMPSTPGETDQYMIWVLDADEARTVRAEPR
jgi:hypothetical protein